jgi:hypothetical protein
MQDYDWLNPCLSRCLLSYLTWTPDKVTIAGKKNISRFMHKTAYHQFLLTAK